MNFKKGDFIMKLYQRKLRMINSICFLIGSFINNTISMDEFVNRLLLVLKTYYFDFYECSLKEN